MKRHRVVSVVCVLLFVASAVWAQVPPQFTKMSQDGTPVPDVDKLQPPIPGDASCWLATAANILAAAGYGGDGTAPAQARAGGIYNQLTAAYGHTTAGASDNAISYWLAWHGKNPDSPDYLPALRYTDVTAVYGTLNQPEYDILKNELLRCQYVGVSFDSPPHVMTLIGWDDVQGQSIWRDSDFTVTPNGDPYVNSFTASGWDLLIPGTQQTYLMRADGFVTLCPGLDKDMDIVANYDLAWAPSPNGPGAREAGVMAPVFGPALGWLEQWADPDDPNATFEPFRINNVLDLEMQKHIQLLVDFYGRDDNYASQDIRVRYIDEHGNEVVVGPTSVELSDDSGQVLFTWILDIQPQWEDILFPSYLDYGTLEGIVASWNVATICVPEPATLTLLALCGIGLLSGRRRIHR